MEQPFSPRLPTVVVIDDDASIRLLVECILKPLRQALDLIILPNSQSGIDFLIKEKVDLLMVDINGPGIMPLRQFKNALSGTPNSDTHLVVMSGETLDDSAYRDFDTLQKPFDIRGLQSKVRESLGMDDHQT
jgi:DNA-binding NtrC family response regulator